MVNRNGNGDTRGCRSIINQIGTKMNTIEVLEGMVESGIYETIEEAIDEYALNSERRLK